MRDGLAQEVLTQVTQIRDIADITEIRLKLQAISHAKYDEYGGYMAGVKFIESLASWLGCFDMQDRQTALNFVLERLVFVSAAEMEHLVANVYQDILRPWFRKQAATSLGCPSWQVARIVASPDFKAVQRRTLVLGMSDGARLDRLRRASDMSTEQFHLDYVLDKDKARDMRDTLAEALTKLHLKVEPTFSSVLLVDDFSGSGATMLRQDDSGAWKGKVPKILKQIDELTKHEVVAKNAEVTALFYLMTASAKRTLERRLADAKLDTKISVVAVHTFSENFPLDPDKDAAFMELCDKYFRESWETPSTRLGGDLRYGFNGSALPLVLHHNAPNNAPPVLWKDDSAETRSDGSEPWAGVFPRHERHHPGRP